MEAVLAGAIADALTRLGVDADASRIGLEPPARDHGDWSTNAALVTPSRGDSAA